MFGELPVWGLFIRHVNGIVLQNINLQNKKSDYRTALLADDVKNIGIRDINVKGVSSAPALFFNKADALSLENIGMPDKKGEGPNDNAGRKRK